MFRWISRLPPPIVKQLHVAGQPLELTTRMGETSWIWMATSPPRNAASETNT